MSNQVKISLIAAIGQNRELGKTNGLLWHIPEDARRFKALTTGHPVIMGRKTFDSLPLKFKPLPNRPNIVVTRNAGFAPAGVIVAASLTDAISRAKEMDAPEIFIIGGGQIYEAALSLADRLYLTLVDASFSDAEIFFPDYTKIFTKEMAHEEGANEQFKYTFLTLEK